MNSACLAPSRPKTAPRDYQRAATVHIQAAFRACRRAVYALPTGGGKTVIAVDVIQREVANGGTVLFVAHRREIINQTVERLIEAGLSAESFGVVMASDKRANRRAPIQVASVDTLRNRNLGGEYPSLIVFDEAHRAPAASYQKILLRYPRARVLGLTATPYRADGRGLREVFDALVVGPTMRTLIEAGHLAAPRVWTVPAELLPNLADVRTVAGDYEKKALGEAVNRKVLVGSIVEHWQRHAEGRRTVVFAVDVAHARSICDEFIAANVPAEHLDGTTKTAERDAILARLKSGETLVVTNCGVLTEGWDMREVKCGILARPTRSLVLYMQMVGRLLRPWGGVEPVVLDHAGNATTLGLPDMDRVLSLDSTKTIQIGRPAPCKTCPACMEVVATFTQTCACGHVFFVKSTMPEVLAGELCPAAPPKAKKAKRAARGPMPDGLSEHEMDLWRMGIDVTPRDLRAKTAEDTRRDAVFAAKEERHQQDIKDRAVERAENRIWMRAYEDVGDFRIAGAEVTQDEAVTYRTNLIAWFRRTLVGEAEHAEYHQQGFHEKMLGRALPPTFRREAMAFAVSAR